MTFYVGRDCVRCGAGFRYVWGKIPLQAGHDSGEVGRPGAVAPCVRHPDLECGPGRNSLQRLL